MRKYLLFSKLSFQKLLEYRLNLFWRLGASVISTFILYAFWTAVLGSGFGSDKYSNFSIATYYFLVAFINSYTSLGFKAVADPIFEGDLAISLVKPYKFITTVFFNILPDHLVSLAIGALVCILFIWLKVISPISLLYIIFFFISLNLAMIMVFFIDSFIGSLAFWFQRVHGFYYMFYIVGGLFSGQLIPVNLLPDIMKDISTYTPFPYFLYFPIKIFQGKASLTEILVGVGIQTIWIFVFYLALKISWQKGKIAFEAIGN